jgi:hypothetical protein
VAGADGRAAGSGPARGQQPSAFGRDGDDSQVRGGETEITDGPFAVTKEVLAGYYILDCDGLDEALRHAARLPMARNGSVEVRPVMALSEIPRS